ncbi:ABC transporter permease [Algiphilus sp.]|uniref:ABC transporter permease n=1 Tax=Algiphilus sp. TaxID=1872431 RepID=UPI003B524E16
MRALGLHWLPPLDRKLLRDLWHIKGQAFAIALVIACGVGVYIMSKGMFASLEETRRAYYERYRFADIVAPVTRAPRALQDQLSALPGVRRAETRIRASAIIDVEGADAPISGVMIALPERRQPRINDIVLRSGRYFDPRRPNEVLVLEDFAKAHGLEPGATFHAILNGAKRQLTVAGLALAPEYVYAIAPGELVPDDSGFGVIWMQRDALAHAFDLDGAFNEALLLTQPGVNETALIERLDRLLKPFGTPGAYGRDQQPSDQFLSNEIQQLNVMARLLPPIFLFVAAFLLNVVITRLIETEREQIGLLKAFGYSNRFVGLHYFKLVGAITIVGIGLGIGMGLWMGRGLATMYMDSFKFPFLLFRVPGDVFLIAAGFSLAVAALGTLSAVLKVMRLAPAVAMVPPAPPDYSRGRRRPVSSTDPRRLDQPTRMILRHIRRWPRRAALTCLGIAMSMGLLVGSSFSLDAMIHMVDVHFNIAERQDVTVHFAEARSLSALHSVSNAPGVLRAEPFRAIRAVLRHGTRMRRETIIGMHPDARLSRLLDAEYASVALPPHGLVVTDKLAELLDVQAGDRVQVEITEGRRPVVELRVARIVHTYMGTAAYIDIMALSHILNETETINGAHLLVDPAQTQALYAKLKSTPIVAGVGLQREAQSAFYDTLQENLGTFVLFNTLFAGLIAIGVVYNSARISLSERGRELASLRVLGLSRGEVSYILLGELALLTILALPVGAGLGWILAWGMTESFDTEIFRIPLIVDLSTYAYAALVVVVAAITSGLLVRRRVDRLDLISVLKTRE